MESTAASQEIQYTIAKSDSRLEKKFIEILNRKLIVEQFNEETLKNLYKAYVEMPNKRMNMSQLHDAFTNILKITLSIEDFDELYQKMNLLRDEGIHWNELLSFFLLEFRVKRSTIQTSQIFELPLTGLPEMINSRHRSFINRIIFSPEISSNRIQNKLLNNDRGSYLTVSRDGIINYWSREFNHQRRIEPRNRKFFSSTYTIQLKAHCMITDAVAMPDVNILCVSSTERNLSFYDTAANKFELQLQIHSFKDFIVCMNYYYSTENFTQRSCIVMGDTNGSVKFIIFNPINRGPFRQRLNRDNSRVHYDTALKNGVRGLELREINHIHTNWVIQVNYYGCFRAFISCSRCSKCSLMFGDSTGTKFKYSFSVSMGISCFTFNEEKQLLFTGGPDCLLRIWNIFVSNKAIAVLCGHRTTICAIVLLNNNDRLLTLSIDRCIKIWEISSRVCIQTYNRLPCELSEHTPMSIFYNSTMHKIIIGSMMIAILECEKIIDKESSDGETHTRQITRVLYNPLFKVIVTTGADSRIIVWDPWRARRMGMVSNAHGPSPSLNESIHVEITAATFDYSYQLLITGGRDGTLKIWSFNSGTCVKSMSVTSKCEITDIVWVEDRILCTGWNRYITEFADIHSGIYRKSWRKRHSDDIVCATMRYPQALATGSHNGELVLWYLETGQPYKSYHVMNPTDKNNYNNDTEKMNKAVGWKDINVSESNNQSSFEFVRTVAVRAILFLCSRRVGPKIGTLIVSLNSGLIQVWSHHPSGGFLNAFSAIHIDDDCCLSLTTDPSNDYLITGHKKGYIKVWLMKNYELTSNVQSKINMAALRIAFPFLWKERILGRAKRAIRNQPLPILVSSVKGHLGPINCIEFVPGANLIVSGSSDRTVRMWSLGGRYISTLGSFRDWKTLLPDIPVNDYFEDYSIPPDIKKIASSTTMRVLMGGFTNGKSQRIDKKEESKVLPDDKYEKNLLYGDRVDNTIIENNKFISVTQFQDSPTLDNSMAYVSIKNFYM